MQGESVVCRRCGKRGIEHFHRIDNFERIALADDPTDPNCGHFYVEAVYIMRCAACEHWQESIVNRSPFKTLREAQKELESTIIGKG